MTQNLTDKTINLIRNELQLINWDNYLETHCTDITNVDSVFNHVHNKICESVNKHAPIKEKTVNIGKPKREPWMTRGIKQSSQKF